MNEQALSSPGRPRPAHPHGTVADLSRLFEVEAHLVGTDLGSVRWLAYLRLWCPEPNGEVLQQQVGANSAEATAEFVCGLVRPDRGRGTRVNRAGVEALFELHQANAGFAVSRQN
jgi:hypothetical protein